MTTTLSMIAGLGNPGDRYRDTLHNAGFWFVEAVAREYRGEFRGDRKLSVELAKVTIAGNDIWLVKPQSFMNLSGGPVRAVLDYYRLDSRQLLVAHDEIDLPPGTVRLKSGGGHGGHNGLRDVIRHCGADFMRLRLGVGHPGERSEVTHYVLKRGSSDVEAAVRRNIEDALAALPLLAEKGLEAAMQNLHTKAG